MSAATSIEWTDRTWNPVRGCSRVSAGCQRCYAEKMAGRFSGPGLAFEGFAKHVITDHTLGEETREARWTGRVELVPDALDAPLRWRKPQRIFVNSMSDLFHEALPFEQIAAVYGVMAAAERHTFQILTKRPARRLEFQAWLRDRIEDSLHVFPEEPDGWIARHLVTNRARHFGAPSKVQASGDVWPLPNVWEGVSVEDQKTADERIPLLLQTPAEIRFVSYEPALGPLALDVSRWGSCYHSGQDGRDHLVDHGECACHLDWVIVGGESGPGARPFEIAWARSVVAQGKAAGTAVFVKQLGAAPWNEPDEFHESVEPRLICLKDRKGGDPTEWPADLRVREFPKARA